MQSAKVIITLWVRWKKPVKLAVTLDPEDEEDAQDAGCDTGDHYIRIEVSFNNLMTDIFEDSNNDKLIQHIFVHIKTQVENPRMLDSGFTLDKNMRRRIIFYRLALTRDSSYIRLPE